MELGDIARVMGRRWLTVFGSIVAMTVIALSLAMVQPRRYEATAHVVVGDTDVVAGALGEPAVAAQPDRDLQTHAELVRLAPFAARLAPLGLTPADLEEQVTVEPVAETGLLRIGVRAESNRRAVEAADAVATAYVGWYREQARERLDAAVGATRTQAADALERLRSLGSASGVAGEARREAAAAEYSAVVLRLDRLEAATAMPTPGVRIAAAARPVSPDPVSPKPLRQALLGLTLGLVLGVTLAFAQERRGPVLGGATHPEHAAQRATEHPADPAPGFAEPWTR